MRKAVIYYFSGCGNSKLIAENTAEKLSYLDFNTELINIEKIDKNIIKQNADYTGFIFPVYGFGLPEIVIKFLSELPKTQKQNAFLFLTPAGHEGIGIIQGLFLLKAKGYDVVRAHSVYMPDTWLLVQDAPNEEKFAEYLEKNNKNLDKHLNEMLENRKKLSIASPISLVILGLINTIFSLIGRHQAGKSFTVNNKCNSCKKCMNECPSKTIKWRNNKPYWGLNCQQCFRCINTCPDNAVEISGFGMLLTISSLFWAHKIYNFIPDKIAYKLSVLSPLPEIAIWFLTVFFVIWITQILLDLKLIPKWCLTKTRKRYKFDKKDNNSLVSAK